LRTRDARLRYIDGENASQLMADGFCPSYHTAVC
jgi:hypothetical protein